MSIYKKLLEVKKELEAIPKDSTNPFFKSKYFDINGLLEHVEPILQKNGLVLLQPIESKMVVSTIVDAESEKLISSAIELPNITDPQKLGSAITYYRRYTLQSLLALQAEDDDANSASKQVKKQAKPQITEDQFKALIEQGKKTNLEWAKKNYRLNKEQLEQINFTINEA